GEGGEELGGRAVERNLRRIVEIVRDDIERARVLVREPARVGGKKLDARRILQSEEIARHVEHGRIEIDTEDRGLRPDARHLAQRGAAAAPEKQHAFALVYLRAEQELVVVGAGENALFRQDGVRPLAEVEEQQAALARILHPDDVVHRFGLEYGGLRLWLRAGRRRRRA